MAKKPKTPSIAAFDLLRSMTADFGDPAVQEKFPVATAALEKSKKVAKALIEDIEARAQNDCAYYIPGFAISHDRFWFGDLVAKDEALSHFFGAAPEAAVSVFVLEPLKGITAAEVSAVFGYDEEEILVNLTGLAIVTQAQKEVGKTAAIVAHLSHFVLGLVKDIENGINGLGIVDLPREMDA